MTLHPVFRVALPLQAPAAPAMWSYSSLTNVEECPLRLWLARARYEFGVWPSRSNSAGVSGTIVHELMREFAFEWEKAGAPSPNSPVFDEMQSGFGVRARAIKQRQKALTTLRSNPRIVLTELERDVELLSCIRQFNELRTRLYAPVPEEETPGQPAMLSFSLLTHEAVKAEPQIREAPYVNSPSARGEQSELKIECMELRFSGTLDRVQLSRFGDGLLDFKTGEPKPEHAQQLQLYALLWWLKTGRLIRECRLVYSDPNEEDRTFAGPTPSEMEEKMADLLARIERVEEQWKQLSPPAKPSCKTCRWCDVRANCPEFWQAPQTLDLRWTDQTLQYAWDEGEALWLDGEFSLSQATGSHSRLSLPLPLVSRDAALIVEVPPRFQNSDWSQSARMRLLNVSCKRSGQHLRVHFGTGSELFWVENTS